MAAEAVSPAAATAAAADKDSGGFPGNGRAKTTVYKDFKSGRYIGKIKGLL